MPGGGQRVRPPLAAGDRGKFGPHSFAERPVDPHADEDGLSRGHHLRPTARHHDRGGLEIHALSIEEKRDIDGHEVLVGALRLRAGGRETVLAFHGETSEGEPTVWNGFETRVRGGSDKAVGVAVTRLSPQPLAAMPFG